MKFSENSIVLQISLIPGLIEDPPTPPSASVSDLMIPHVLEPLGAPLDSVVGMSVKGKRRHLFPEQFTLVEPERGAHIALESGGRPSSYGLDLVTGTFSRWAIFSLEGKLFPLFLLLCSVFVCSGLFLQFTDSFSYISLSFPNLYFLLIY